MSLITESQIKNVRRSSKTFVSLNESLRSFKNESPTYKDKNISIT